VRKGSLALKLQHLLDGRVLRNDLEFVELLVINGVDIPSLYHFLSAFELSCFLSVELEETYLDLLLESADRTWITDVNAACDDRGPLRLTT
jgi:hypothetical protein